MSKSTPSTAKSKICQAKVRAGMNQYNIPVMIAEAPKKQMIKPGMINSDKIRIIPAISHSKERFIMLPFILKVVCVKNTTIQ
jgi:hypothetical protein